MGLCSGNVYYVNDIVRTTRRRFRIGSALGPAQRQYRTVRYLYKLYVSSCC